MFFSFSLKNNIFGPYKILLFVSLQRKNFQVFIRNNSIIQRFFSSFLHTLDDTKMVIAMREISSLRGGNISDMSIVSEKHNTEVFRQQFILFTIIRRSTVFVLPRRVVAFD